jgi:hypothetical protein
MGNFKGDNNSRRIDRALQHVSKPWFPMNPEVLKQIRSGLTNGAYENHFDELLTALKSDFALFTFVIKELSQKALIAGVAPSVISNPLELIRWGGLSGVSDIIDEQQKIPTIHSLQWSEPFQVQRLRETAIIATTASELSKKKNLDPQLGFSRGVLREMGLNLIAWNYPSVYQKVLENLTQEQNLDDELAKELGFTPDLLALRLFRPDKANASDQEDLQDDSWATYDELCDVGEALARAEHPETYPSAENDWKTAKNMLLQSLGEQAITIIRERAIENTQLYQKSLPEVFGTLSSFDPEKQLERHRKVSRAIDERFLRFCSEQLQNSIKQLYSEISGESVDKALVGRLLKDIIPDVGFSGGCVFVVDPSSLSLKPRTLIGKVQLRTITNVALEPGDAAVSALSEPEVTVKTGTTTDGTALAGIYSALGTRKKIGVLYLETPRSHTSEETLGIFHVLKKALCDVLLID